jgi:hypothetical protein
MRVKSFHRRQPPHLLLHDVGQHVAVHQAFFGLFGQHGRFVEADVALLQQLGFGDQLLALRRAQLEPEAGAQLELAHLPRRIEADHHFFALLGQHVQHHLCAGDGARVDHPDGVAGRDAALELLAQR